MPYSFKYPVVLFLASFVLLLAGLLLKFQHWPGGQLTTWIMLLTQVISVIWLMSMLFKYRYPAVLFLTSFVLFLCGISFKIMHWPNGQLIIASMLIVQIIAVIWLIVNILRGAKA